MKLCAWCTFELITEYIKSYWKAVPAAGVLVTGSSDRALGMKCQSGNDIPSSSIFYCHIPSTVWNICSYLFIEPLGLTYPKSCLTSWNCHFKGSFFSHSAKNVAVKSLSSVQLFTIPWTTARQASLSFTISWSLLKLTSIESVMPSNHLIHCYPFSSPSIRIFSNESALHIRWPKYQSFSFSISPSNGYSGWISFRMDWLDLLAVQGTLKSLLQYHSSKASVLQHSAFFTVQLSHAYTTTGKTIALT